MAKRSLWKEELSKHQYFIYLSIIFIIIANLLYALSGMYADKQDGTPASDLILDNLPAINLSFFFSYGLTIIMLVLLLYPLIFKPRVIHVALTQLSFVILIRSFFVALTHLKVPPDAILSHLPRYFDFITFNNDLFFSGHVAVAFLGFLLFRKENSFLKYFFLISTVVMAVTVLFMHVHYSIDVFAAFFITYGSYKIGEIFLNKLNNKRW
jgi:membrane-associated phospholipid phosphatase